MKKLFGGKKDVNPNSDAIQKEIQEMIVCSHSFLFAFSLFFDIHVVSM